MLEQAEKDFLTDCYAKSELLPFVEESINNAKNQKRNLAVCLIDLDRFKKLNHRFGHVYGDDILKYVASTVRLTLKDKGFLFRYGGDEFVAVFPGKTSREVASISRQYTNNLAHRPFLYNEKLHKITISVGIAGFPKDGMNKFELINKADKAMYVSKHYGRNLVTEASKIGYIKLRNFFLISFALHVTGLLGVISNIAKDLKSAKTVVTDEKPVVETKKLVTVITKDGTVFKGELLGKTDQFVIVNFKLDTGAATIKIDKKDIAKIKHHYRRSR